MSSSRRDNGQANTAVPGKDKAKKTHRACDSCRRKKCAFARKATDTLIHGCPRSLKTLVKCDAAQMPDHRCSRCIDYGTECTYQSINFRAPKQSYVQVLESRLKRMEEMLEQLHPNAHNSTEDLDGVSGAGVCRTVPAVTPPPPDTPVAESDELEPSDDELEVRRNIFENWTRVPSFTYPPPERYHGKSSNIMILQAIVDMKEKLVGPAQQPMHVDTAPSKSFGRGTSGQTQRLQNPARTTPPYGDFPSSGLMNILVDAFFTHYNLFIPLLHRPSFEQGIKEELHLHDRAFGAVVLLVCANGSRVADGSRDPPGDGNIPGWKWFIQVGTARWSYLEGPRIEELQTCALIAMYLWGSKLNHSIWSVLGQGLRMAQDMGAHRRKMYSTSSSMEGESIKRAFWALIILDRTYSFSTGRPCAIHDEDIDTEPLLEVDDEYWISSDPERAFKQPEGQTSYVTFANCLVRLLKILTFACRTIYSINKSKLMLGMIGPSWEQKMVAELDSAVNKWVDLVPPHLKWDPNREDPLCLNQSAMLHAYYYLVQIAIHRPFIQSPRKTTSLTLPSLAICTNAARSCTHVLDIQLQRTGVGLLLNRAPLFCAGLVLLLNFWAGKRSGMSNHSSVSDIRRCIGMLQQIETYTHSTRPLWVVLDYLISSGEDAPDRTLTFGEAQSEPHTDVVGEGATQLCGSPSPSPPILRPDQSRRDHFIGGSGPTQLQGPSVSSNPFSDPSFGMPIHTEELGRLPLDDSFNPLLSAVYGHGTPQQHLSPPLDMLNETQPVAGPSSLPRTAAPPEDAAIDASNVHMNILGSSMEMENFSDLFSILSASYPLSEQQQPSSQQQSQPQQDGLSTVSTLAHDDTDVSMSTEDMSIADSMMEMWSTAPTSFDWAEWEPYLTNMTGMSHTNPPNFSGPPPASGS